MHRDLQAFNLVLKDELLTPLVTWTLIYVLPVCDPVNRPRAKPPTVIASFLPLCPSKPPWEDSFEEIPESRAISSWRMLVQGKRKRTRDD